MKITNVAAIVAAAALTAAVFAQGRPPQGGPPGMGGGMGRGGGMMGGGRGPRDPKQQAERTTEMMTQMLGLTADQQKKVMAIVLKSATEMKKLRDAQTASIKKILTPAQQAKMASMTGPGGGMGRGGGMMGGPPGGRRGG